MAEKEESVFYEKASAATLAEQPIDPVKKKEEDGKKAEKEWSQLKGHLEGRLGMLRTWRNSWWIQSYADLARFILPRRSIWMTQSAGGMPSANSMTRGLEINENILDPTATLAARICSGGLITGLCSPSRPWFKIIPAVRGIELDDEARIWIDSVEEIVYTVLARSNFYKAFAQECEDIVVYGTSVNIIYEDEKKTISCYTPCVGEYYLSSSATMQVDGLYRTFVRTVAQIVEFFGIENCTPDIQKLWKEKGGALTTERLIAHSIEPNFAIGEGDVGKVKGAFTWREVYWVYGGGSKQPLSIRGFMECPFTASRWSTQSNDAYGRSPGMDILPDVMQLQVETARKAEGIEKGIRPPLLAHSELKNSPSSLLPGHVTYLNDMSAGKGIRSIYEQQFDLNYISQDIALIQQRIKTGLFNDLFMMISQTSQDRETATSVNAKVMEKMAVLGPVIEGLIDEGLQPKLRRIFAILKRKNLLPPPPQSLHGVPLDLDFISTLALAQKSANLTGLEAIVRMTGELAQMGKPEALEALDCLELQAEYSNMLGNKQKILKSKKVVEQIIQQRQAAAAKQQQDAQQAAQMGQAADAAHKVSGAVANLSGSQLGGGQSALSAMLGGGQ